MTQKPPPSRATRQFSLRALFKLTLLVAILLTIGVLYSPWEPITMAVPIAVWFVDRARLFSPRWFGHASIALYGISMCLPAVSMKILGDPDIVFGWVAFYMSFAVLPEIVTWSWPWNEPHETIFAFAYLVGAAANTAFLLGFFACLLSRRFSSAQTFANRAARLAIALVVLDLVLLLFTREFRGLYPGYGFWLASMLALAFGTRRSKHSLRFRTPAG
jgi:hypothetical protein